MQVPVYQNNTPNTLSENGFAHPAQNIRPTFDYESAMTKALQPLHEGMAIGVKAIEKAQAQQVKAEADEALNALDQELRELQWNPESGYYSMKGRTAVEGYDPTREAMQKAYQSRLDKLENPLAKQAFSSVAKEKINSYEQSMQRYRLGQNNAYKVETSEARLKSLIDDYAFSEFSPDSDRTLASITAEVEYLGKLSGKSDDWINQQKENYVGLAYASAYTQKAVSDPFGAYGHFLLQGKDKMRPDIARKTYSMLLERASPEIVARYQELGGPVLMSLTTGAVSRTQQGGVSNIAKAQQGPGVLPKVDEKILNTQGYKSCNPLNIKAGTSKWVGEVGRNDKGFVVFDSPINGVRAAVKILRTYDNKYGVNTVEDIVSRFSPSTENSTCRYISEVCKQTGFAPNEKLDMQNPEVLRKLVGAMMRQEIGGNPYSEETISKGISAALGETTGAEPQRERLTPQDIVFNPNVRTGDPILDAIPTADKIKLFKLSKQSMGKQLQQAKVELKRSVDNALAESVATGDTSALPDVADFIEVYGQDEGVRLHKQVQEQVEVNSNIFSMPSMSKSEMDAVGRSLTPETGDPDYSAKLQQKQAWDKAKAEVLKKRVEDPMDFAMRYIPDTDLKPITDWNQPVQVIAQELSKRAQMSGSIGDFFDLDVGQRKLLTNSELQGLNSALEKLTPEQAAPIVSSIAQTVLNDGGEEAGLVLINQLMGDKGHNRWSAAFVLATDINAVNAGFVQQYIAGSAPEIAKAVTPIDKMDKAEALNGLFPTRESLETAGRITEGIYNYRTFAGLSGSSLDSIVEDVYGQVQDYNGGKIFLPRNAETSFGFLVGKYAELNSKSKTPIVFMGREMSLGEFTPLLRKVQFISVGDGKYLVKDGTDYVRYKSRAPLVLDFSDAITKANKTVEDLKTRYYEYAEEE